MLECLPILFSVSHVHCYDIHYLSLALLYLNYYLITLLLSFLSLFRILSYISIYSVHIFRLSAFFTTLPYPLARQGKFLTHTARRYRVLRISAFAIRRSIGANLLDKQVSFARAHFLPSVGNRSIPS